ncbi:MAG: helix-turn-helix transcriptional regulator [Clostridia bacterium]|nr:helix-turn-helix transcriptional regulator [Clostridia bacterium]
MLMVKNLRNLRLQKGISQQQLAEIIGVTQQSIYKYETQNVEPDLIILTAIADYFATSVDYLIGHSEINHKIESVTPFDLNNDEADLINSYRTLTKEEKDSLHLIIKNYNTKK